jgi:hypothetical protein
VFRRELSTAVRTPGYGVLALGLLAVLGGIGLPDVRAVLFVTGSIGLFGSAMTWYLTPERVVPIAVSESIYDAAATTLTGVRDELGLQSSTAYVPVGDQVRGFVPRHRDFDSPENAMHVFVTDDDASRGFSFAPAGDRLAGGFERLRETQTPDNPLTAAEQLAETLVSHFEIADAVTIDADTDVESSRLTVSVQNAAFGPLTRPDHPVVSALACEIVQTTDSSVVVDPINDTTVALETDSALEE